MGSSADTQDRKEQNQPFTRIWEDVESMSQGAELSIQPLSSLLALNLNPHVFKQLHLISSVPPEKRTDLQVFNTYTQAQAFVNLQNSIRRPTVNFLPSYAHFPSTGDYYPAPGESVQLSTQQIIKHWAPQDFLGYSPTEAISFGWEDGLAFYVISSNGPHTVVIIHSQLQSKITESAAITWMENRVSTMSAVYRGSDGNVAGATFLRDSFIQTTPQTLPYQSPPSPEES